MSISPESKENQEVEQEGARGDAESDEENVESPVARSAHDESPAKREGEEERENAGVAGDAVARNYGLQDASGPDGAVKFDCGAGVVVFGIVAHVGNLLS